MAARRGRLFIDVRPVREHPAFRRLLLGTGLSALGSQMTSFAVALQIYTLTGSSFAVGGVGLAVAVPSMVVGLFGGAHIDALDRRKLVLATSSCLAGVSALFTLQAYAGLGRAWPLYCLVVAQSMLNAVNGPASRTFMPRLLPTERVAQGVALNVLVFRTATIGGPALAGVIAAAWGLKACYLIDTLSFAAALYAVARLPAMRPEGPATRPGLRAVGAGLRFIGRHRILTGAFLSDMSATVLGMPFALFPGINADHFGGSPQTLGLLTAAPAVGGVVGTLLSGPVTRVSRQGLGILLSGGLWGLSLLGFGLVHSLGPALILVGLAGAADTISVIFRSTVVQVATPDQYRGRVNAAEYVVGVGCPQLGNFRAGAVGSLTSASFGLVSGGVTTVISAALIGLALPDFTRYRADRVAV
ncbi:MFS transporter [Streptomyces sp. NPDC002677]|uniref:MFS transporter n=1 Tax=Streptomyces sp. NPDC002677 TaxID=3154774 RepID=UPI00331C57D6